MPAIASSATSVLIAHVAAHTERIRLGSGGIMLPNHAPLTIAEQFGTLAELHPGRIDLGLGRAPGSDQQTMRALRRDPSSAESFPQDVLELQGYLTGPSRVPGIEATPGKGTNVPLYILGSSLFGAQLAAALGLPYAFASHFAPARVGRRDRDLPPRVPPIRTACRAVRDRRRQRDRRRRHRRGGAAAVPRDQAQAGRAVRRTRAHLHTGGSGHDSRVARGPAGAGDGPVHRRRHADRGGRLPRPVRRADGRRRADGGVVVVPSAPRGCVRWNWLPTSPASRHGSRSQQADLLPCPVAHIGRQEVGTVVADAVHLR